MKPTALNRLVEILEKENINVISIESAHSMSDGAGDITSLSGDKIKAAGKTMIEIRVVIPTK